VFKIQLELLMMSGIPLETCRAFNERWNNKFCYKVASCWLFLLKQIFTFRQTTLLKSQVQPVEENFHPHHRVVILDTDSEFMRLQGGDCVCDLFVKSYQSYE